MTTRNFSRALTSTPARAAFALLIGLGICTTAFAGELKAPSGKSRLLRDNNDVTIVIIDKDDNSSSSHVRTPAKSQSSTLQQPSSRVKRDDDEVTIRFKRDRTTTSARTGPKIIIIDRNSGSCDGGGVCVIRP